MISVPAVWKSAERISKIPETRGISRTNRQNPETQLIRRPNRRGRRNSAAGLGGLEVAVPPGGSLCYCTCAQEAISTKSAGRKWLVSGLEDHRYLSVTKSATRREPVGGTPTSKQEPCSGMHLMLSLSTDPWICHISSRVQVCTDSNGNAESPSPRAGGPTGMGCEGSPRGVCADSIGKS